MQIIKNEEFPLIQGGATLSTAEWATIFALSCKTAGDTLAGVFVGGQGWSLGNATGLFASVTGSFVGLWVGFQLYHSLLEDII